MCEPKCRLLTEVNLKLSQFMRHYTEFLWGQGIESVLQVFCWGKYANHYCNYFTYIDLLYMPVICNVTVGGTKSGWIKAKAGLLYKQKV